MKFLENSKKNFVSLRPLSVFPLCVGDVFFQYIFLKFVELLILVERNFRKDTG